ncbi:carboxypeptidase regulatory-like domain-containing protein [Paludisphaera soli]|uniref:carboxypeptidase regulatory-like domain-containing protein n=1 Tax=Paludisphaera soli TaxID=2712865 RepID=UPI0013EB00D3|nr:carboxypeptidase regulatory-like domain-containing protein [Paludisphaera soli]
MSELLGGLGVFDFARIVAVGVAALSASAWLAARAMKRPPARHLVLTSALGCCLAMPALAAAFLGSGRSLIAVPLLPEMPATAILPRAGVAPVAPPPPLPSPPPSPRGEPLAASTGPRPVVTAAPATSVPDAGSSRPADRPRRRLASAAIVAWGLGSAFLLLRLARSFREVRRIRREARPVDEPALRLLLGEVCRDLGLARLPALVASAEAAAPFAAGLGRPVVVLPERLVGAIGREAMRDVLAHEAAHILKNDHLSILAQELARALYWPIPTIHALARDFARAREALSDNHVLKGRDPLDYGETLLHLAEFSIDAKAPRVAVGILPRQGELERRIAAILDPRRKTMTKNSRSLACLVVLAFLALGAVASGTRFVAAKVAGEEPEKKEDRSMLVRVLGPDGRPMRGVVVRRSVWLKDPKQAAPKFREATDEAGEIRIPVLEGVEIFRMWAWAGGHVPLFAHWEKHDDPDGSLPAEFIFRMERGTAMGGIVRDESGAPIPGAAVKVMLDRPPGSDRARVGPDMWLSESATGSVEAAMITDAQGRWALDNAPPGDDVKVLLFVSHPGYQSDDGWGGLQKLNGVDMTSLRDQTATITMRGGVRAAGTVTDPDGKPVAGAVVVWGDHPYFDEGSQEVLTDAAGSFRLPALAAGSTRLTVVAEGWMPETRTVALGPDMASVNFQLRPGKELRVRFVDRAGSPVPDVHVGIRRWRGSEALYNHRHPNVVDTKIPEKADGEGVYRWTWAPDDSVTYQFSKPGEFSQEVALTADGSEKVVVVGGRRIAGSAVDASTGKPVAGLVAMPVLEFRPGFLHVVRRDAKGFPDGSYTIRRDRADVAFRVRVEAPG